MNVKINFKSYICVGCDSCVLMCPVSAISLVNFKVFFDYSKCIKCKFCEFVCPMGAIEIED
ncbi:4Fe-4S binding domain-containing protein [Thermodesulfobium acidiphilum]|uniref:4Fe-4S binding domain-containing protein n=1 Tax=Thermodesulfobium acidiphilum TaxID=1794699 RepID=A0A2R4W0K3_THEAF|nr:4Fe-4S binding protein [Thermodesulfobium acidiphilum]AWB10220.1 4Fe-4S binding domain-containing protein [Thermodesulfobium acidiphilum]